MTSNIPSSNVLRQQLARQQIQGSSLPATPDVASQRSSEPGAPPAPRMPNLNELQLEESIQVPQEVPVPPVPEELPAPTDPFAHRPFVEPPKGIQPFNSQILYEGPTVQQLRDDRQFIVPTLSPRQSLTDLALSIPNDVWNDVFTGTNRAFGRGLLDGFGSIFNWEEQAGKEPIGLFGPVAGAIDFYAEQLGFQAPFGNRYGWNFDQMGAGPVGALFYSLGIIPMTTMGVAADIGREAAAQWYASTGSLSGGGGVQNLLRGLFRPPTDSSVMQERRREFYRLTEDGEYLPYTIRALRGDRLGFSNFRYDEDGRFEPFAVMGDAEDFRGWTVPPSPAEGGTTADQWRAAQLNIQTFGRVALGVGLDLIFDPLGPLNNFGRSWASRGARHLAPAANTWAPAPDFQPIPSYRTPRLGGAPDVGMPPPAPPRPPRPSAPAPRRINVDVLPDLPPRALPPDVTTAAPGLMNNAQTYTRHFVPDMPQGISVEIPSVRGFDVSGSHIPQPRTIDLRQAPVFAPQVQLADAVRYANISRVARPFDLRRINLVRRSPADLSRLLESYSVPSTPRTVEYLLPSVEDANMRRHLQHTATPLGVEIPQSLPPSQVPLRIDPRIIADATGRVLEEYGQAFVNWMNDISHERTPQNIDRLAQYSLPAARTAVDLAIEAGEVPPQIARVIESYDLPRDMHAAFVEGMSGASFFVTDTSFFKVFPQYEGRDLPLYDEPKLAQSVYDVLGEEQTIMPRLINASPYHVEMERIQGVTLYDYLTTPELQRVPPEEIASQFIDIFDTLRANDLIITDAKLVNMLVDNNNKLWLIDPESIESRTDYVGSSFENMESMLKQVLLKQPENRMARALQDATEYLVHPRDTHLRAAYPEIRETLPPEYTVPDMPDTPVLDTTSDYLDAQERLEEVTSELTALEAQLHEVTNIQVRPATEGYIAKGYGSGATIYRNADNTVTKSIPQGGNAHQAELLHDEYYRMAKLQHLPFVPRVYGMTQNGYIMEYVDGSPMLDIRGDGDYLLNFPESQVRDLVPKLHDALTQMAEAGILYYDLHGGNVIILPDGSFKIIDFGMAADINAEYGLFGDEVSDEISMLLSDIEYAVENESRRFEIEGMPHLYDLPDVSFNTAEDFLESIGSNTQEMSDFLSYVGGQNYVVHVLSMQDPVIGELAQRMFESAGSTEWISRITQLANDAYAGRATEMNFAEDPDYGEIFADVGRRGTADVEAPVDDGLLSRLQEAGWDARGNNREFSVTLYSDSKFHLTLGVEQLENGARLGEVSFDFMGEVIRRNDVQATLGRMMRGHRKLREFQRQFPEVVLWNSPTYDTPEGYVMRIRAYTNFGFDSYTVVGTNPYGEDLYARIDDIKSREARQLLLEHAEDISDRIVMFDRSPAELGYAVREEPASLPKLVSEMVEADEVENPMQFRSLGTRNRGGYSTLTEYFEEHPYMNPGVLIRSVGTLGDDELQLVRTFYPNVDDLIESPTPQRYREFSQAVVDTYLDEIEFTPLPDETPVSPQQVILDKYGELTEFVVDSVPTEAHSHLNEEEINALRFYQSLWYAPLNAQARGELARGIASMVSADIIPLRNENDTSFFEQIPGMRAYVEGVVDKIEPVYGTYLRGIAIPVENETEWLEAMSPGNEFTAPSLMSMTTDPEVAKHFTTNSALVSDSIPYILEITGEGRPLPDYGQSEFVAVRGARYTVEAVTRDGDTTIIRLSEQAAEELIDAKLRPVFAEGGLSADAQVIDIGGGRNISLPAKMTRAIADAVPLDAYDAVAKFFGGQPVPIQEFMARGDVTFMEAYMHTLVRKKFPGVDITITGANNRQNAYAYYTLLQGVDALPDGVSHVYVGAGRGSIIDGSWGTTYEGDTFLWQDIVNEEPKGTRALVLSGSTERAVVPELAHDMWLVLESGKERPILVGSGNFYPAQAGDGASALRDVFRRYNNNPSDIGRKRDVQMQSRHELEQLTREVYNDFLSAVEEFDRAERALREAADIHKRAAQRQAEEMRRFEYRQRDIDLGTGNRDHCI